MVGEDAAFFDVEQQTTKSWTLFTGLLIGVLGLIYVVRGALPESMVWPEDSTLTLPLCRHGSTLTRGLPTTSLTFSKAFLIILK